MKKRTIWSAILAFILILTACQSQSSAAGWTQEDAQAILASGAFSDELETVDADTAFALYKLADYGLDREALTECQVQRSAGATCEELAILQFSSESDAATAKDALEGYIQNQITANQDYRPSEIPKLESAWVEQRGKDLLLVVADDLTAAKEAVSS
jgi:hypothetical protein